MTVRNALISVYDKAGIECFARRLNQLGWRLLSTGGTLAALRGAGIEATAVEDWTGFPEILDGRVKTLHPRIHGGLLARTTVSSHREALDTQGIEPIDLVCVNLYPFEQAVAGGADRDEAIENIDIGGPSMLRSAAKNHERVTVVCDPADYDRVIDELTHGDTSRATRRELAVKVFARTAAYDAAIERYLARETLGDERLHLRFVRGTPLRYGENPHQQARFFCEEESTEASVATSRQLHGKELSFNNIVDADAALEIAREFSEVPAAVVIKHLNPCGLATGTTVEDALVAAWGGDPISAFGSVIALTREVDLPTAELLKGRFVEILIAPSFQPDALAFLQAKSKDIRLLAIDSLAAPRPRTVYKHVIGGMLVQDRDVVEREEFRSVTRLPFPMGLLPLASFTMKCCKHLKSNAIAIGAEYAPGRFTLAGAGMGQPNRIDSNVRLAQPRVIDWLGRLDECPPPGGFASRIQRMVLASDAFFPFPDNIDAACTFGIRHVVQPGGSVKDDLSIARADELGMTMAFTGIRHFRH